MNLGVADYSLLPVLPEIMLAVGAMLLLMLGAYRGNETTQIVTVLAVFLLVATGACILFLPAGKLTTFGGSFVVDDYARFLKILALIGSGTALILSRGYLATDAKIFEYAILIMLSTVGMMVLISAGDLITLYLGLELMSLALYVVAASHRDDAKSTEAGLKYFVLGALSSGMLLYGASLIYGFTGTVTFTGIAAAAKGGSLGVLFGVVFLLAGLCFKVSAVPFHMWTPDVYEGAPTPVTAFFASAPKVAALAVFTRRAGCSGLHRDLCRDDARHVRVHHCHETRRAGGGNDQRFRRSLAHQSGDGIYFRHAVILVGRRAAACWLLCEVLCVSCCHQGGAIHAVGDRRARKRGRRVLLSHHREDHVFRRTQGCRRSNAD